MAHPDPETPSNNERSRLFSDERARKIGAAIMAGYLGATMAVNAWAANNMAAEANQATETQAVWVANKVPGQDSNVYAAMYGAEARPVASAPVEDTNDMQHQLSESILEQYKRFDEQPPSADEAQPIDTEPAPGQYPPTPLDPTKSATA